MENSNKALVFGHVILLIWFLFGLGLNLGKGKTKGVKRGRLPLLTPRWSDVSYSKISLTIHSAPPTLSITKST